MCRSHPAATPPDTWSGMAGAGREEAGAAELWTTAPGAALLGSCVHWPGLTGMHGQEHSMGCPRWGLDPCRAPGGSHRSVPISWWVGTHSLSYLPWVLKVCQATVATAAPSAAQSSCMQLLLLKPQCRPAGAAPWEVTILALPLSGLPRLVPHSSISHLLLHFCMLRLTSKYRARGKSNKLDDPKHDCFHTPKMDLHFSGTFLGVRSRKK